MALMKVTAVDGTVSEIEMNEAIVLHGVDDAGNYLGLVSPGNGVRQVEAPPPIGTWNWNGTDWNQTFTLVELKAFAWDRIKACRDVAEFSGFVWDGSTFDSDQISQSRVQGGAQLATLAALASQAFSVPWTLQDNSVRVLSGSDMLAAGEAMGIHVITVHGIGRALRDAIEAATTQEELEAIVWPAS